MREEARRTIEALQLGQKLRYYRTNVRHWTLVDLSKKTGLSMPLLSQIENNFVGHQLVKFIFILNKIWCCKSPFPTDRHRRGNQLFLDIILIID